MTTGNPPENIRFEEAVCDSCKGAGTTFDSTYPFPRRKACNHCYGTGHSWTLDTTRPITNKFVPDVKVSNENLNALADTVTKNVLAALREEMKGILSAVPKQEEKKQETPAT